MLDKTIIKFLKFLIQEQKLSVNLYLQYCKDNKINRWYTVQMYIFLKKNEYIQLKDNFMYPTFITEIAINNYKDNKFSNFLNNFIFPYIHDFFIFVLGLAAPYLLELLKQIISYI